MCCICGYMIPLLLLVTFHIHEVYNRVDSINKCTFNQLVWISIHFNHLS